MSILAKYPALKAKMERDERQLQAATRAVEDKVTGALPQIAKTLLGLPGVEKAFLFGSFATGRFRPDSDVDIAITAPSWTYSRLAPTQRSLSDATGLDIHLNFSADVGPEILELEGIDLRAFA